MGGLEDNSIRYPTYQYRFLKHYKRISPFGTYCPSEVLVIRANTLRKLYNIFGTQQSKSIFGRCY